MSIPSPKRSNLFSTIWSKFNLRRREKKEFKNVAHGLIPAATIGPRFGVPRTPPPLSPNHSPERPRSALAIATSSSSPTAGTVARPRSQSESRGPCPDIKTGVELHAATGRYSSSDRDRRPGSKTESHVFSLEHSCDEAESDKYEGSEQEEEHVYQSLETQRKADDMNEVYAVLLKHNKGRTSSDTELTEDTVFDIVSPMYSEGEIVFQKGTAQTQPSSLRQPRSASNESMASSDLSDHMSRQSHNSTFKKLKKKKPYKKENRVKRTESDISPDNSESLRCELEERQALITELREQARVQVEEKEILERRCLQQREQIEALQMEISCKERTSTDNSESLRCELEAQQALVTELREQARVQVEENEMLRKRCLQQSEQIEALQLKISLSCKEANPTGNDSVSLRQQAEELEDENIQLKTTVHRLNVELSKYQAKFRPLTKDENSHLKVLLGNRPAPPWLFDMKYLSPLLLAYEDHLNASAEQLKSCEEELQALRARTEEIIKENENLHSQISQDSSIELKQIKEMAHLVLEENQVLLEQLELQQVKSKEVHSKQAQEVFKASKQLMLLESENQNLEKEMERERKEHFALKTEFHRIRLALENSLSLVEHNAVTEKLKRQLQEQDRKTNSEIEELMTRLSALETEKKFLLLDKNTLSTDIKHMETELQHSEQAKRKAQRHINILKQEVKDSLEKELIAHQYLASIVTLAEKSTHERDQLLHMTSSLENNKQGILANILEGTVNLGKLQEKVKVYKQQASASVGAMGRRLHEQEEDFAGKAASYQREIRHLQSQLRDRQEQLHGAMQQKREVEGELEVVYEAATRESQRLREVVLRGGSQGPAAVTPVLHGVSGQ